MFRRFTKKRAVVALSVIGVLAMAGAAFAYFTSQGSGTGSATVGTAANVTLTSTITGTLYPGGAAAGVSVDVKNNGSGSQRVGKVQLDSVSTDAAHSTCDTSAFAMADITVDQTLAKSASTTVPGSLKMNDTGGSQDDCQGAS